MSLAIISEKFGTITQESQLDQNAFCCCVCKTWMPIDQAYENCSGIYCQKCKPIQLLPRKNYLIGNQEYVGQCIKVDGWAHGQYMTVVNVTGQWFYGFDKNNDPKIVNISLDTIKIIELHTCDHCWRELPEETIKKYMVDENETEMSLCDSCFEDYEEKGKIFQ
jgi:uncharacterized CHY-type Zn-finger protein